MATPVSDEQLQPAAKRRRIPKACTACRRSKLRCNEQRPCSRCVNGGVECVYHAKLKDPVTERLDTLEAQMTALAQKPHADPSVIPPSSACRSQDVSGRTYERKIDSPTISAPRRFDGLASFAVRQISSIDAVGRGLLSEADAMSLFATFFAGSVSRLLDYTVPIFDAGIDTFDSLRGRSNILFDIIVIHGARAAHGIMSKTYQPLHTLLRRHTSDLILRLCGPSPLSLEDIQATLVIASYSDNGPVLVDIALHAADRTSLGDGLNTLLLGMLDGNQAQSAGMHTERSPMVVADVQSDHSLITSARVYYYIYVLDSILSLDGGKPASMILQSPSRRVRSLLDHRAIVPADLRLFAQVELNTLRTHAHNAIVTTETTGDVNADASIGQVVQSTALDLQLWASEWQDLAERYSHLSADCSVLQMNIRIQHAWALMALYLRALTASGIENIALMTNEQQDLARAAKSAAETHLELQLSDLVTASPTGDIDRAHRPYIASFRYAMEFVWAKNAFSILIALRLSILLGDAVNVLIDRLNQAKTFLDELSQVGMGVNASYLKIVRQTVQRCERAVEIYLQPSMDRPNLDVDGSDFQSFVPKEFVFEWDFPGLHLCYVPVDWEELFLDFGAVA